MIILEGPDNSGKTTLADKLAARLLSLKVWHSHGPPKSLEDLEERMRHITLNEDTLIVDRYPPISENVYGPLLRPGKITGFDYQKYLDWSFMRGHLIVYCRPPLERLVEGHTAKEGEDPAHIATVEARKLDLINRYDAIMATIPHISYDYTKNELAWLLNFMVLARSSLR